MIGSIEDAVNKCKPFDPKSAIYESVNQLRKWREGQLQKFQMKQLNEQQSLFEQSEKNKKNLEQFFENNQVLNKKAHDKTCESATGSESTLQDSSVIGHFLRCFSDTSGDSSTFNQSKETSHVDPFPTKRSNSNEAAEKRNHFVEEYLEKQNSAAAAPKRPKQPFLKKGSGLLRYMSKRDRDISNLHKSSAPQKSISDCEMKSVLKSKSSIQSRTALPQQLNRVQFKEPIAFMHEEPSRPELPLQEKPVNNVYDNCSKKKLDSGDNCSNTQKFEDDCNVHLSTENQELAEFEMLENCAQNSSFNSDSSIVQRVLHGEPIRKLHPIQESNRQNDVKAFKNEHLIRRTDIPVSSVKDNQIKTLEEMEIRKQQLQNLISDINPRISSLQNEISNANKITLENDRQNERCSTPVEYESRNMYQSLIRENEDSSKDSSMDSIIFVPQTVQTSATDGEAQKQRDNYEDCAPNMEEKESTSNINLGKLSCSISPEKQKLREKMNELENEIKIYQETNARLSVIRKEREEILAKLKKEHDEIHKYKEDEKRKLDTELENERKQLKREKDTFHRFQKLRRDNPGKKEREEISSLRQEVEKLQEDMKRQKNKFNSDCRRMKNQLIAAEKERDTLKLQNITLEEQCQDLLSALKTRNTKKKKPDEQIKETKADSKVKGQNISSDVKTTDKVGVICEPDVHKSSELNQIDLNYKSDSNSDKPRVRFNLIPEYDHDTSQEVQEDLVNDIHYASPDNHCESPDNHCESPDNHCESPDNHCESPDDHCKLSEAVESSSIHHNTGSDDETPKEGILYEEINQDNKLERIYSSGEREIILPSGTLKHISADGKYTKILYYNGDIKEIFPDKNEIYRYVTGVIEKRFPSGLEITEFPNGQIQQIHPDGLKEVRFPDGTTQYIFPNGTEEVIGKDGTVLRLDADGTETIEFSNGEKLIRTATSKRREYPDGSVKIIYNSGRQETRFANGRIRIKDKDGKLVVDTKHLKGLGG